MDLVQHALGNVESAQSFHAQHPFVPVSGEAVDVVGLHIHRQHAQRLDRVDAEQDIFFFAELSDAVEVVAEPGIGFDRGDRQHPRPAVHLRGDLFERDASAHRFDPAHFDAEAFQVHPRIHVGGELDVGDDHVVAGFPVDSVGDDGDAFRRVFDEGDFFRFGIDEPGEPGTHHIRLLHPVQVIPGAVRAGIFGKGGDRLAHPFRQRRHPGVIPVNPVFNDREFLPPLVPIDCHNIICIIPFNR